MRKLHIDIETYSSVDLKTSGVYRYVDTPDFSILLIGYAFDDEPVQVIDLANGEPIPYELFDALIDEDATKYAFNASFELTCMPKGLPGINTLIDPTQWRCVQAQALYNGLPDNLAMVGSVLKLDEQKMNLGKALIAYFCTPDERGNRRLPSADPDKWDLFKEYCKRDVEVEREIEKLLQPLPDDEQQLWLVDQQINRRGIALEPKLLQHAQAIADKDYTTKIERMKELTSLANPNSVAQLKSWLGVSSLNKESVKELLEQSPDPDIREVLELRQQTAKSSLAKYDTMLKCVCGDGRVRGLLQFYGANRTGRWAGRLVQVHNLPRNNMPDLDAARTLLIDNPDAFEMIYDVSDTLSQLIRTAFVGNFLIADYSAIEARVISWYAREQWRNEVFATHGKIYEASAAQMFRIPIEEVTKDQRSKGKIAELALGYQGAAGALITMGALRIGLTEEELPKLVSDWRQANKRIVEFWAEIEQMAKDAIVGHRREHWSGLIFARNEKNLHVKLPSGRVLIYRDIQLVAGKISYAGFDQQSRKWIRMDTYGGKLVENIVQATARDCLAEAMKILSYNHWPIVMHIHDEVVIDIQTQQDTEYVLAILLEIMRRPISWAPGLILNAEGFVSPYYKKE